MFKITNYNKFSLFFKILFLVGFIFFAGTYPVDLMNFFTRKIWFFNVYHVIWLIVIIILFKSLISPDKYKIASGKQFARFYKPAKKINLKKLKKEVEKNNLRALKAGAFWLSILFSFSAIYFLLNLNVLWVYGFALFALLLDTLYVAIWCPYRDWIIKNKCCNTCRIYNWGLWMSFGILATIPNFWNLSIVALSIVIFLQWEYLHYKHPERFYEITNLNLKCVHCKHQAGFCKENK